MPRYVAHLVGHPCSITIVCKCVTVRSVPIPWLVERFGLHVTIEAAEKRMRCKHCGERVELRAVGRWAVTDGRDRRVNPPPMPTWVDRS